jgi:large subunit ribosomal protein L7/L12
MSEKIDQIVESLKTLTLLEASELVTKIEETFGVDASASVGGTMVMAAPAVVEEVEEQTEFNVILDEVPADKKIAILKVVRSITGLGLKEAKELVESAPKSIKENIAKDAAEDVKKQIEAAGGKASLK